MNFISEFKHFSSFKKLSCYAAKFDNHNLLELCSAGILPARIIQTKCTTAYSSAGGSAKSYPGV